jgi:hypothetical protein
MRKGAGGSAGLLAMLALFLHTQLPNSESGAPAQRSGSAATSEKKRSDAGERMEMVAGPWVATQAFFHAAGSSVQAQESDVDKSAKLSAKDFRDLLKDLTSPDRTPEREKLLHLLGSSSDAAPATMFSIVATVADPSHTHMSLLFDEQTEAIEGAARDAGWDFAEQWLPWVDRFNSNEGDITARRTQRRVQREQEEMPGVLVFRHEPVHEDDPDKSVFPDQALFVFLVPETLTAGVNGPAFYSAMHLAQVLSSPESNQIGLLAPTFSGSFASLSQGIRNMRAGNNPPQIRKNTVYGGTVSNRDYANAFENKTGLTFHSGVFDSKEVQLALCVVLDKYDMEKRAAVLKEDEGGLQRGIGITRLGEPATCGGSELQTYVIPREISHLRNAYQEASGEAAKDPYSEQQRGVSFSIKDPNSGEDSIPTFSETQTPLTQETILNSITDELIRQRTHMVFISVSNPLDALFLLQALRRACPDARVLLEGPNVLFVAAAAREALGGTLFLSPYPMFFEGDDWLECAQDKTAGACEGSGLHDRIMFAEPGIQGLYNVTQFLLKDLGASKVASDSKEKSLLRGYRQPGGSSPAYPGMWLLTLNRFGFLPVDLLPEKTLDERWFEPNNVDSITALTAALPTAPRTWRITVFIVSSSHPVGLRYVPLSQCLA